MAYALPSDEERYAMLTGTGMYGGGASQSMPSGSGGYYSQPYKPKPEPKNYGSWQDAMTAEEMRTIGDDILDEEGNPTGKKVYADWRIQPSPKSYRSETEPPRYAGSGGGITGIPGGGLLSDKDRYSLLTGSGADPDFKPSGTGDYDSSNYNSNYGISSDADRFALLTGAYEESPELVERDAYMLGNLIDGSGWDTATSRDFDESTGTYNPGYRGLSSDEDRYSLLTGSGGSSGYTPSNYSLSGLSSGLSSDEDRYSLLTGRW